MELAGHFPDNGIGRVLDGEEFAGGDAVQRDLGAKVGDEVALFDLNGVCF